MVIFALIQLEFSIYAQIRSQTGRWAVYKIIRIKSLHLIKVVKKLNPFTFPWIVHLTFNSTRKIFKSTNKKVFTQKRKHAYDLRLSDILSVACFTDNIIKSANVASVYFLCSSLRVDAHERFLDAVTRRFFSF